MGSTDPVEHLRELIEPLLERENVELVDLKLGGRRLTVFIDKDGGIGVDDCARMNRAIGDLLDVEDPMAGRYLLEVSSPGLDRPLRTPRDFGRSVGRKVMITRHEREGVHQEPVTGIIQGCGDGAVALKVEDRIVEITLEDIATAQLTVEF